MKSTFLLFLSRLLTKSGDNAWHFALPLALVHIYPDTLRPVSLFFFTVRLGLMFILPIFGRELDKITRSRAILTTILPQVPITIGLTCLIAFLASGGANPESASPISVNLVFILLVALAILSQGISHLSSVLVTADFIPHLFHGEKLTRANTVLRRIDLLTEIFAPLIAGYVLSCFHWSPFLFSGFLLVAIWNMLSFLMEYFVLRSFLKSGELPDNRNVVLIPAESSGESESSGMQRFFESFKLFFNQTAFLPILGLAVMHITVLSGPNIVGTSFLKAGWNLSEAIIGMFRATSAVMSIFATMFIGSIIRKHGLARSAAAFSAGQAVFIILAACAFEFGRDAAWLYLGFIVLSRFGHSGFILCEMQIRQETVPESHLGLVNGMALSINSLGSLVILLLGTVFGDPAQFGFLVWTSAAAILTCACTCRYWALSGKGRNFQKS